SRPFNPNGKSRLERWFRTLDAFSRRFDTYTGRSIDTKPERLKSVLARPHLIPAFDLVYERLKAHIAGYNANARHKRRDLAHAGERISPNDALAQWTETRR